MTPDELSLSRLRAGHACRRCRRTYEPDAWTDLELIDVLDSAAVQELLSDWPAGVSIEIRRCRCGGELARADHRPG